MAHYNLIFQGEIIAGADLDDVKNNVAKLFKADAAKTALLFSGKPIVIKKNLDKETTKKYLSVLKKSGAVVKAVKAESKTSADRPEPSSENNRSDNEQPPQNNSGGLSSGGLSSGLASLVNYNAPTQSQDKPSDSQPNQTEPPERASITPQDSETQSDASETLQLAPVNSGTLNQKQPTEAIEIPDIQHLSMSDPQTGSLEEFAQPVAAIELPNIDSLSMSEADTGSLEEFASKVEAVELPDISDLDIAEQNETPLSSETPRPNPVDIPDISSLSMSGAEEGTLEGLEIKPEPVEVPDTSHIDIEKHKEKQKNGGKATFQID